MENLKQMEDKINFLEKILSPAPVEGSSISLLEKIEIIDKKIKESNYKPQISFIQKMKDFESIYERYETDVTTFLSNRDKLKLMLSSTNMLDNIQTDLNDMMNLKQHLEFDPYIEIKEKNDSIITLSNLLKNSTDQFEDQNNKTNEFFTINQTIVTQINKKLLYLDSIISILEKKKPVKS